MTNIVCLLYVGWVTNYVANVYIKVQEPVPEKKLEEDNKGETLRIIERLDRLENVVSQHIQVLLALLWVREAKPSRTASLLRDTVNPAGQPPSELKVDTCRAGFYPPEDGILLTSTLEFLGVKVEAGLLIS
ncbi:UNVERIFIED_CONTAM: hypothetical protein FKN15_011310 [Acipenser sinensis]